MAMKIYTKGGDAGETGLIGNLRVPKDHIRIRAYGTLDELNAALGVVCASTQMLSALDSSFGERLTRIQGELFQLGAELATPRGKDSFTDLIGPAQVSQLETEIDEMEQSLSPLKNFILPGGALPGAYLHLARTIARRAERDLVPLHRAEPVRAEVLEYVNRLSDYLFVCARWVNAQTKQEETPWKAPRTS